MLLEAGHTYARHYPLAVTWSEARIVRQRHNDRMIQDAIAMQAVVGSVFAKKGTNPLQKWIKRVEASE